jgi:hypothetical protein
MVIAWIAKNQLECCWRRPNAAEFCGSSRPGLSLAGRYQLLEFIFA